MIKVRFGETDMAGHVNNAVYLTYLEEARIDFLKDALGVADVPLILASVRLDFLRQTFFGDRLRIETGVSRMGRSSFDVAHRLYREGTQDVVMVALAVVVHFNYQTQTSEPLPESWRDLLKAYETTDPFSRAVSGTRPQ